MRTKLKKFARLLPYLPGTHLPDGLSQHLMPTKGKMISMRHEDALFAHCQTLLTHLDSDCAYCIPMLCWS